MPTDSQHGIRVGRPLAADGTPADGPALDLDPDGPAAARLREAPRALVSSPGAKTWATLLETPAEGETDRPVLLQWLAPDASEPPPHTHPTTERFTVIEGTLSLVVDGERTRLGPGESTTVEAGAEHTFRNDSDETVAFVGEPPSMLTVRSLFTIWGRDHEGAFADDGYGEPGPLDALVIAAEIASETRMTGTPLALQRLLWATVGRAARLLGYDGIEDRYLDDEFWTRHVDQPSFGDTA
ncbi:cupin domain-containing protein [Halomicrobium sp. LC1Hm]|uniref:cupin domain-containing protein n=1 Tax=Halomicrobium sp. LC1Hm TaxID=2610902 RepID=UPI0012984DCC|nr:cupin domain-containing protein [Halomicrobium sp. LC1Hm]QGA81480.1 Cupin domain containing protein [Halomicrobium sp. LC1Hm]